MALVNNFKTTIEINVYSDTRFIEGTLGSSALFTIPIYPGMLLSYTEEAGKPVWVPMTSEITADVGQVPVIVCVENLEEGKKIGDTYVNDEKVYARHFRPGDIFLGRAPVGTSYTTGDYLSRDRTGSALNDGLFGAALHIDDGIVVCHESFAATAEDNLVPLFVK